MSYSLWDRVAVAFTYTKQYLEGSVLYQGLLIESLLMLLTCRMNLLRLLLRVLSSI